jgi:23S rRNA (adenine2503-C2)-methyltransferase
MTAARSLHDLRYAELESELAAAGVAKAHARTLWRSLYAEKAPAFLPPLTRWLERATFTRDEPAIAAETASTDGLTHKLLLRLADGQTIETVIMRYRGRATACLSTQVGCAMGCVFCATGQMGFTRHLRPGEIVAQALAAQRHLRTRGEPGLRNLVLMGMGEPLHNYDAVMTALAILADTRGLNLGPSRITISTVGVVPGILRLAAENQPYNLAVSLHGANEEDRTRLVPLARRWPLAELIAACRTYAEQTRRRIFFEWTLIAGTNDSPAHATQLAALLAGLDAHVNLIPLNPTGGYPGRPSTAATSFQGILHAAGIPSTVRQRRGLDVAAGCGQLRSQSTAAAQ